VEQGLAAHGDVEGDVWVRFAAARVVLLVLLRRNSEEIPLDAGVEVLEVDAVFDDVLFTPRTR